MRCVKGPAKDSTWRRPRIRLHANSGALGISLSPEDWHLRSMGIGMKSSGTLGKSESVGGERGSRMGEDSGGDEDGRAVNAGHTLPSHTASLSPLHTARASESLGEWVGMLGRIS